MTAGVLPHSRTVSFRKNKTPQAGRDVSKTKFIDDLLNGWRTLWSCHRGKNA